MNLRTLLAAGSLVASMVFPSLAGAQVQFRVRVGGPPPVVVHQPAPVVVAQPQPVYVQPAAPPVYAARPGRWHRGRRAVIIQTPHGAYVARRHGGRHWRH